MSNREKGICRCCGRAIAIMRGSGPDKDGEGFLMEHKFKGTFCFGSWEFPSRRSSRHKAKGEK